MVPVVLLSQAVEKIVPAMHRRRLDQLKRQKQPQGQDMRAQQHRRQDNRQRVGEDVLQRVGVLRRKGHRCGEFVVRLMYALVQRPPVEQSVRVVEERLTSERADDEVPRNFGQRWKVARHAKGGRLTGGRGQHGTSDLKREDDGLVAQRDGGRVQNVSAGRLLRRWLDLVRGGKRWRDGIEEDVNEARQPPKDYLDELAADNVNDMWVVSRHYLLPQGLHLESDP